MSQSLSNLVVHIVFSTKDRRPFLRDRELREALHRQTGAVTKTLGCLPIITGGVEYHIHVLARQSRTLSLADWVKELKRVSSIWVKEQPQGTASFAWQSGYGAFSVSQSNVAEVVRYIQNQEEHHKTFDFKEEFRKLLERNEIEYDERYVWD